jgi:adenylate cyclase class 2
MKNDYVENEIKIHTPNLDAVAARLVAAGAKLTAPRVFERNVRYETADQTFSQRGIVLRLRQDARARLTYKEPGTIKGGALERFEAEVTVDNFDTMDLILRRLGFQPYIVYEKYRTTYELGAAEIVLDEMPYGHFIEIEAESSVINATLNTLGLQDSPRILMSYLMLFAHVKTALGLFFHDLTFANFDGVTVPPELFHTEG